MIRITRATAEALLQPLPNYWLDGYSEFRASSTLGGGRVYGFAVLSGCWIIAGSWGRK